MPKKSPLCYSGLSLIWQHALANDRPNIGGCHHAGSANNCFHALNVTYRRLDVNTENADIENFLLLVPVDLLTNTSRSVEEYLAGAPNQRVFR